MNPFSQRHALARIGQDKLRQLIADHGASIVSVPRHLAALPGLRAQYLELLMLEHRLSNDGRLTPLVKENLGAILERLPALIPPTAATLEQDLKGFRALVLRAPAWNATGFRRGVLLIKFTETFRFFFNCVDIPRLMTHFHIVLEPSWSGYCLPEILLWARYPDPVVVQASEKLDRNFLDAIGTNLRQIEIGASDWVDDRVFRPLEVPKTYGVIYVANLTPMKRVNVYLRALRDIRRARPDFKAALVVSSFGGNQAAFEEMVRMYGLDSHLKVLMNQTQQQLNDIVNRSRVSVLLSRKEGSNKTLFESMFANTPVILLKNNVGVNKDYINDHTGRQVAETDLAATILEFAERQVPLQPRAWAIENISAERSTRKLHAKLCEFGACDASAESALFVKMNTPEATYRDAEVAARMPGIVKVLRHFSRQTNPTPAELEAQMRLLFTPLP